MIQSHPQTLVDTDAAAAAVADLCAPFDLAPPAFDLVAADRIPQPARALLVHDQHMTVTLERHYGGPVHLEVLDHREGPADQYARRILLRSSGGQVVEIGLVRIDLSAVSPEARAEIVARRAPLGSILIRHDVLRRIEPRWFLRLAPGPALAALFPAASDHVLYGRVGTLYCGDKPAINLLEIVTCPSRSPSHE